MILKKDNVERVVEDKVVIKAMKEKGWEEVKKASTKGKTVGDAE